ncbi:helix-turn-helix domain-containing protein [Nonomuraea sp. NPDC005983]|uniref:TetR/AcrR family transcriptional regulator n=1 Tax=Nonomuraea sp. NPDC005983 TaxID=3155595 RepID=UPI0033B9AC5C
MMAGLRELKKEQTRQRICEVALRLFDERGYEAVTVNEIAEAAGVAKVTLFNYFPTKECLVLSGIEEDYARIVTERPPGQSPLDAFRAHYRAMAADDPAEADVGALLVRVRVITASPELMAGVHKSHIGQRYALAAALGGSTGDATDDATGDVTAHLMAAQITASITTLQETFFHRLTSGMPIEEAGRLLAQEVEVAFDLLEYGFSSKRGEDCEKGN